MEKTGILRKTFNDQKQKKESFRAKADEESEKDAGAEILLIDMTFASIIIVITTGRANLSGLFLYPFKSTKPKALG